MSKPSFSRSVSNRITKTLFITQAFFGATQVAAFTVVPILSAQMADSESMAGVPMTVAFLARSIAAYPIGLAMDRWGRRAGLSIGYLSSMLASIISFMAVLGHSFFGFCIGGALSGVARSSAEQARFIAAEIYPPDERALIISRLVFAGTISAIGGALLVPPSGTWISQFGLPPMSGPFAVGIGLGLTALILTQIFIRPDPIILAQNFKSVNETHEDDLASRSIRDVLRIPNVKYGIMAMVIGQFVMTLLMVITPLHMNHNNHGTWVISWVIMAHALGMFGVSGITGRLVGRFGQNAVIKMGVIILMASCIIAPISPQFIPLAFALFLLGLGWNFCFISGSSLLSNALAPHERGRIQGINEMFVSFSAATASLATGIFFDMGGLILPGIIGLGMSIVLGGYSLLYTRTMEKKETPVAAG
jgi:MFS family permease